MVPTIEDRQPVSGFMRGGLPIEHIVAVVLVIVLGTLVSLVLLTDEAEGAWSYTYARGDNSEAHSGEVDYYQRYYLSSGVSTYSYVKYKDTTPRLYYYYYSGSTYRSYDRDYPYMGFEIGNWADNAYIRSAKLSLRVTRTNSFSENVRPTLLVADGNTGNAYQIYVETVSTGAGGYPLSYQTISSTGYYEWTITGSALNFLASRIAGDDSDIFIGIYASGLDSGDYCEFNPYYCTLYIYGDWSSPNSPRVNSMAPYSMPGYITFSWMATTDRPSTNRGLHYYAYQAGVFLDGGTEPISTTSWLRNYTLNTRFYLTSDGVRYHFKVKARDVNGFESNWAYSASTRIDASPPSVPSMFAEPLFTPGTSNEVSWTTSTDAGIGLERYYIEWSTTPTFTTYSVASTTSTTMRFSSLTADTTFHYRVRARDLLGYYSAYSAVQSSTQDSSAPSVPMMMDEPAFTAGTENTFNWHPSTDAGVGVDHYRVQVSTGPSFGPGDIELDTTTTGTSISAIDLVHGRTYYARARAIDGFAYVSAWSDSVSSRQDDVGPSAPGLHTPPEFSPEGPVTVSWNGSIDSGIGVGWYKIHWSNLSDFSDDHIFRDHIVSHSYIVYDLEINETWYFKVYAYDALGNMGLEEVVNTTVDGIAPAAPVIGEEPEYTPGSENTITWSASTDDLSGIDHYLVRVFARAGGSGLVFTDTTDALAMTVPGLADGATYWYQVTAVDVAGNAAASALEWSTQDASPPTRPHMVAFSRFTPGTSVDAMWRASIDSASGGVEYMLEWAEDAMFTTATGDSGWQTTVGFSVTDLMDNRAYHFRVKARDALGQESMYGDAAMTTMDASAPPVPTMDAVDPFVRGPFVRVSWQPVQDLSGMPVEYQVKVYDTNSTGGAPMATYDWVGTPHLDCGGLPADQALYFAVVARDHLAWTSEPSDMVVCTIDTDGPGGATIDGLPAFTGGTGLTVSWTEATDDGIGMPEYRLVVYSDEGLTSRVHLTEWTLGTSADVFGLADGMTYWFVCECRDGFGNVGDASEAASTTMDTSAPMVLVDAPGLFGTNDGAVSGTVEDATSGVDSVEASGNGGDTWVDADLDGDEWSIALGDLPSGTTMVLVRATDAVGNTVMEPARAVVDTMPPAVTISLPTTGSDVSGAVVVLGSISDAHLASYIVEAQASGSSTWTTVQPLQATTGVAGTLATWVTAGLSGGAYTIRVTATDAMGLSSEAEVDVVLKGAHISIGPGDITFSDTHPLPGDKVTVLVTVRNDGDSPAEDVTVIVYDGGVEVGRLEDVTVPAHGVAVVPVEVTAKDEHEITARASSDLYDTGAMTTGQPLKTIEEEAMLENAGGILGLVALILAVVAILLALMLSRRGGDAEPVPAPPEEEMIIDPVLDPMPQIAQEPAPEPLPPPIPTEQAAQQVEVEQVNMLRPPDPR